MSSSTFRADIQGLRAVAVMLVVLAHFDVPPFSGGFVGVDVFFVISGFLITGILWRELEQQGRIRWMTFYTRRLKRLLPALITMVVVTVGAAAFLLSGIEVREQTGSLPYALSWTSNLYFAFGQQDYFAWLQGRDLYLHTWSLGVEEQFYLLWPMLLLWIYRVSRSGKGPGRWVAALGGLSLLVCILVSRFDSLWAFYLPFTRLWEFALGAAVYWWGVGSPLSRGRTGRLAGLGGLLLIAGGSVLLDGGVAYPGAWALLPAVGSALVLAAGPALGVLLSNRALVWLGDRSYSLYLWHWPVLLLGAAWLMDQSAGGKLALFLLALVLSVLSYRLVEYPFWKGGWRRVGSPWQVAVTAAVSMIVVGLTGVRVAEAVVEAKGRQEAPVMRLAMDVPPIYPKCDHWYTDDRLEPCEIQAGSGSSTVFLVGDSIGAQWTSLFPLLYPRSRIVVLTKSSCPMVDEPYFYPRIGREYKVCERWRNKVLDYLDRLRPDLVFVGSASTYPFSADQWVEGSLRVWKRLSRAARQVHVIAGTPRLGQNGPACLARIINRLWLAERFCSRPVIEDSRVLQVNQLLASAVDRIERVSLLDMSSLVCPGGLCRALTPKGVPVYRDSQHLTDSFVISLAPEVEAKLRSGAESLESSAMTSL
ncbi:MAG TPA: acyltransferase [Methylothermaceae bacterium]|nr:acyltransferase [Methylothermaceae bacterium]